MAYDDRLGYHEVLHTAHILVVTWDEQICEHGLMESELELKAQAEFIGRLMVDFYQLVARAIDKKFEEN